MFIEYTKLVLNRYEEKRANGTLSQRLIRPTPAQLKEECITVCSKRYERRDQGTLNSFFGEGAEKEASLKAITRCGTDSFKPLVKFLRKETKSTEDKNIELLAWLIDFDERPFVYGKRYVVDNIKLDSGDASKETDKAAHEEEPMVQARFFSEPEKQPRNIISLQPSYKKRLSTKTKTGMIVIIILVLAGAVIYWLQKNKSEPLGLVTINAVEACMYWVGDHYEQTSCTQKHGDTQVVALDTFRLKHFKKITRPDTITLNAIGSVWYIRINGGREYFTANGYYPLDPNRKLNPITAYIINKHILTHK